MMVFINNNNNNNNNNKQILNSTDLKNYRPILNLSFLSTCKLVNRTCHC